MIPHMATLFEYVFWVAFGGCLMALFAYDIMHSIVDLLLYGTRWLKLIYNKSGGADD